MLCSEVKKWPTCIQFQKRLFVKNPCSMAGQCSFAHVLNFDQFAAGSAPSRMLVFWQPLSIASFGKSCILKFVFSKHDITRWHNQNSLWLNMTGTSSPARQLHACKEAAHMLTVLTTYRKHKNAAPNKQINFTNKIYRRRRRRSKLRQIKSQHMVSAEST